MPENKNYKDQNLQSQQTQLDIKSEFLDFYKVFEQYKKNELNDSPTLFFDVNAFVQSTTASRYYDSTAYKYTKKQIRNYLERPETYDRQLREVSLYLYSNSQEYRNLINYFSKMLINESILIPTGNLYDIVFSKPNNVKFLKSFYANLEFLENYNLKSKLSDIEPILVREDIYFGYERTDGENFIWQQLPTNFSRILGWDEFGNYTMEFDFTYFTKQNVNINNFAQEFQDKYELYKKDYQKYRWQKLSDKAIVFKLDKSVLYTLPQFSGIFDEVISLAEYKDLQEDTTRANNFKLVHQKIPQKLEKDSKANEFMIDEKAAVRFHQALKNNLPTGVGCATTPMVLTDVTLKNSQFDEDLVGKAEKNMFISAGVSQLLFSSDANSSIGLNRSIEADSSLMFSLLRQFELFMKKKLKEFNGNGKGKFKWKLIFPNVTIFNMEDYRKALINNAQSGYSKFCTSMSQSDIIALLYLENQQLQLTEQMIPLKSSYTTPGEAGNPGIDDTKKSDSTIIGEDLLANDNRSSNS